MTAAELLVSSLGSILTQDDTPRSQLRAEADSLIFDYGPSTSQFGDFIDGVKQQRKARFVFGSQFIAISDIVFHDRVYQSISLEWKATKLLELLNETYNDTEPAPITLPTFHYFIKSCNELLGKEAAERCISRLVGHHGRHLRHGDVQ